MGCEVPRVVEGLAVNLFYALTVAFNLAWMPFSDWWWFHVICAVVAAASWAVVVHSQRVIRLCKALDAKRGSND